MPSWSLTSALPPREDSSRAMRAIARARTRSLSRYPQARTAAPAAAAPVPTITQLHCSVTALASRASMHCHQVEESGAENVYTPRRL